MTTWDESKYERDQSGRFKAKYNGQAGRDHRVRAAEASKYILEGGPRPDWVKPPAGKAGGGGGRGGSGGGGGRSKGSSKGSKGASRRSDPYAGLNAERDARVEREKQEDAADAARQAAENQQDSEEYQRMLEAGKSPEEAEAMMAEKAKYRSAVRKREASTRKASRRSARQSEAARREAIRRNQR